MKKQFLRKDKCDLTLGQYTDITLSLLDESLSDCLRDLTNVVENM